MDGLLLPASSLLHCTVNYVTYKAGEVTKGRGRIEVEHQAAGLFSIYRIRANEQNSKQGKSLIRKHKKYVGQETASVVLL